MMPADASNMMTMPGELGGALKASKTKIELFLSPDSFTSVEVKLQHTGGNQNPIAFEVLI